MNPSRADRAPLPRATPSRSAALRQAAACLLLGASLLGAGCGQPQAPQGSAASPASAGGPTAAGPAAPAGGGGPAQKMGGQKLSRAQLQMLSQMTRFLEQDRLDDGAAYFRRMIASNPRFPLPYFLLASLLEMKGDLQGARSALERGTDLTGGRSPLGMEITGNLALHEGKYDAALESYRRMEQNAPRNTRMATMAYVDAAYIHLWREGPKRARAEVDKALTLDPRNPQALRLKLALDLIEDRRDEAVEVARRMVAVEPDRLICHLTLASVLRGAGHRQEAQQVLEQARAAFAGARMLDLISLEMAVEDAKRDSGAPEGAITQIRYGPMPDHVRLWKAIYPAASSSSK